MAERTFSLKPLDQPRQSGVDEQLWPIVCATMVLVGILGVIVAVNSDFDEERLFLSGYTHLASLAVAAALLIFIASLLKGAARRTAELAMVLSLALHAGAGVGAFYLFTSPLSELSSLDAVHDAKPEFDDEPPPSDDRWAQDQEQGTEQAFEKVVVTTIREQVPPADQLQPNNRARPAPAADIRRAPNADITPLGVGGAPEPSGPMDIRRPDAAKIKEVKPLDALAMVRQKGDELPLPKTETPVPIAVPNAPIEPPKTPDSITLQANKIDWASMAKKAATPNNEPLPPPHKMARVEVQPGEPLPSTDLVAQLPTQAPSQTPNALSGPEAADQITQQGSTLERSTRDGAPLPSTVVPDAGLSAQSPAAPGGSPPSRLEAVSTVPVEKSDSSRAPLGSTIASGGAQDFGRGSALLPSRRGAIGGRGKAQPSIEGDSPEDPAEVRSGAPGSDLRRGLSLPSSPARRAIASQTEDGGSGPSASFAARLPRTQGEMGLNLPTAAKIVENTTLSGAGGAASNPGGQTSTLDVGQHIAIRRTAGSGTPRGVSREVASSGTAVGDMLGGNDTIARGNVVAAVGRGLGGPRRIELGTPEGGDNAGDGIPRARSEGFAPHPTATPVGSIAGTANVTGGPMLGGTSQSSGAQAIGPSMAIGGIGRRESLGQGIGSRPSSQVEPTEIAAQAGVTSPHPLGVSGRSGRGDGELDQILSGSGLGVGRPGHGSGSSQVVVSGQVHEPMEPFRRDSMHGGLILGDSAGGQLTEPAIENGLEYFSHTQFNDGHWSLHELPEGIVSDPASLGALHADTAATGLALLTYLGAGYNHQDDKYRDVVRRGVQWLVKHQQSNGSLSHQGSDPTHYYSHGIATMALCEAYGMTQDRELREPAQKAIDFIVKSQDPSRGGWRYKSQDGSDTSVTGWQLMALKSAQMAGLEVPQETLRKVSRWLDLAQVPNRGTYVYNPWNSDDENPLGRAPNATMTAQAMLMRMYLGQDRQNASLAQGADYLLAHLPDVGTQESAKRDCYYWYYATQAMYHMQGDYWKTWDARITPLLRAGQIDLGPLKGSWSPREPVPDKWSSHGGRHYVTSMHILTLEFRYWHLPLFRELRTE